MYLRHLKLRNLKLLREVDISFLRGGEPRMWTVFVGKNGLCKTAILQSIALAASGPTLASELADVLSLPDRRRLDASTSIEAEFGFGLGMHSHRDYPGFRRRPKQRPRLHSRLETEFGWRDFSGRSHYLEWRDDMAVDPLLDARRRQLPAWFVAGYGTVRALPEPVARLMANDGPSDHLKNRLDNLFDRGSLLATSFTRLFKGELAQAFKQALWQVLTHSGLLPGVSGLEQYGPTQLESSPGLGDVQLFELTMGKERLKVPATWMSKGYQGTIAWVADLVGQILLDTKKPIAPGKMEGLVLVDELDLHLHPTWQAALIPALKKTFPRLQFVGTTHSAMLLPGLAQDEILLLRQDEEGSVHVEPAPESPALMTGSEILDTFFDLHRLYPNELGEALRRYGYLASNAYRSEDEEREMHRLLTELKKNGIEPGWTAVPRRGQSTSEHAPTSRKVVRKKTAPKKGTRSRPAGKR